MLPWSVGLWAKCISLIKDYMGLAWVGYWIFAHPGPHACVVHVGQHTFLLFQMLLCDTCVYCLYACSWNISEEKAQLTLSVLYFFSQEKAQHLQRTLASQVDKSTQTELVGHDVSSCAKQFFFYLLYWYSNLQQSLFLLQPLCLCVDVKVQQYLSFFLKCFSKSPTTEKS